MEGTRIETYASGVGFPVALAILALALPYVLFALSVLIAYVLGPSLSRSKAATRFFWGQAYAVLTAGSALLGLLASSPVGAVGMLYLPGHLVVLFVSAAKAPASSKWYVAALLPGCAFVPGIIAYVAS